MRAPGGSGGQRQLRGLKGLGAPLLGELHYCVVCHREHGGFFGGFVSLLPAGGSLADHGARGKGAAQAAGGGGDGDGDVDGN